MNSCSLFQIKSNAVRALGNLSRFVKYSSSSGVHDKPVDSLDLSTMNKVLPANSDLQCSHGYAPNVYHPNSLGDPRLLERMVQAFLSCVTTGNVKVFFPVVQFMG